MTEIIGIRFKPVGKVYYFSPMGIKFNKGDYAIVETVRDIEIGEVVILNKSIPEEQVVAPLKPIIRKATKDDFARVEAIKEKEKKAFGICVQKIKEFNLEMHLVDVEYTFDENKILFYFTAEGRVDFRELVKSLATIFRTRIELRQIGVRDEVKILGGLGICGRPFCCHTFLGEFQPVSIKMAKEQSLSLNPTKISGSCGRLMCCLKYEQEAYEELLKHTPKTGAIVETADGRGTVTSTNLLRGRVTVKLDNPEIAGEKIYLASETVIIKDAVVKLTQEEIRALKDLEE